MGFTVDASPPVVSVTPSDTTVYDPPLTGLRVSTTAGDIAVVSNGVAVTVPAAQLYEHIPGSFSKVMSTGTAAVGIIGWQPIA